jgi:hypothetical protein
VNQPGALAGFRLRRQPKANSSNAPPARQHFEIPRLSEIKLRIQVPRWNMDSSARSELKSGLAESRIETKLPINKGGVLHACLSDVSDSDAGVMKSGHAARAAMRRRCI